MRSPVIVFVSTVALLGGGVADAAAATCSGRQATIVGTRGSDHIVGTAGRDVIQTFGGDDVILGLEGNDWICASLGADEVSGGGGPDRLDLGPGDDVAYGGGGKDKVYDESGADMISSALVWTGRSTASETIWFLWVMALTGLKMGRNRTPSEGGVATTGSGRVWREATSSSGARGSTSFDGVLALMGP